MHALKVQGSSGIRCRAPNSLTFVGKLGNLRYTMKLCAVLNCGNSTYHLQKWMGDWCPIHQCNYGTSRCVCDPPFKLFPFPTERKNPKGRQEWINLINRTDPETGECWAPKSHSRVCSKHFPDGRPTHENANPINNLILEPVEKPKRGRSSQMKRKLEVPKFISISENVIDADACGSESDSMELIESQNGNECNISKNNSESHPPKETVQNLGISRAKAMEEDSNSPAVSNPGTPRSEQEVRATPPPQKMMGQAMNPYQQQLQQQHMLAQMQGSQFPLGHQSQSKYTQLLAVIEDMGKDIRPTYSGSKMSAERLKRGIVHARILVRECLMECERSARN
ncbi:uncharacterized protein LOC143045166 [Mytilus galloprovincialis]|uniref:uncharacterized protein LOC143045166 n=1 Tax=Mytilus galloprovincialis TaxID=29158 RepID=UPI003F7B35C5